MGRGILLCAILTTLLTACSEGVSTNLESSKNSSESNDSNPAPNDGSIGNGPLAPPSIAFKLSPTIYTLAHDKAQYWEGCEVKALVNGGYSSQTVCGRAFLHPRFAAHLNTYFHPCILRAAKAAGIPKPERIFMNHFGSYNDREARGSSRLSMHAYARAIDLAYLNLYDKNNTLTRVSANVTDYKGTNKIFYDDFRQCWKESMPRTCGPGDVEWEGSIGIPGSKLGGNSLHNDHIHLSYSTCGG